MIELQEKDRKEIWQSLVGRKQEISMRLCLSVIAAFVAMVIVGNLPGQLLKEEPHLLVVNRIHGRVTE